MTTLTPQQVTVPCDQVLESITDRSGIILDVSPALAALSGYQRDEMIGQPHNMLRHPDMPKAAFADMWSQLEQGLIWRGIVINRCKSGDFYWVEVQISPIFEGQRLVAYLASRRPAQPDDIARASQIYRQLN